MALAADQGVRRLDEQARRGAQPAQPVLADADNRQPPLHGRAPVAKALTAAAANALPARRPPARAFRPGPRRATKRAPRVSRYLLPHARVVARRTAAIAGNA